MAASSSPRVEGAFYGAEEAGARWEEHVLENMLPSKTFAQLLPPELRARIAFFACVQDREFREKWAAGHFGSTVVKGIQEPAHGRSLNALAATDRAFHVMCSQHIFENITALQTSTLFFRHHIVPRHAARVHSVDLNGSPLPSKEALALLSSFPNLKEIHLSERTARNLFGELLLLDLSDPSVGQAATVTNRLDQQRATFYGCASSLERVRLSLFHPSNLSIILQCFTNLHSLRIHTNVDLSPTFALCLEGIPNLQELSIRGTSALLIPPEWTTSSWPALVTLTLRKVVLNPALFAFIGELSTSLRVLHLTIATREVGDETYPAHFTTSFPLLNHLSVTNVHSTSARDLLLSLKISPTSLSPLAKIDLRLRKHQRSDNQSFIQSVTAFRHTLRELTVMLQSGRRISTLAKRLGTIKSIFFTGGDEADLFLTRKVDNEDLENLATKELMVGQRATALISTLSWGISHISELREEGNFEELEKAFDILEKLKVWEMLKSNG
ncbi:hypothetical protein P7C70_g5829, partial [Phenoliferia sp. Uapishka_3]